MVSAASGGLVWSNPASTVPGSGAAGGTRGRPDSRGAGRRLQRQPPPGPRKACSRGGAWAERGSPVGAALGPVGGGRAELGSGPGRMWGAWGPRLALGTVAAVWFGLF